MTNPSDPTVQSPVAPAPQVTPEVEKVARRFVRARGAVSNTLKHFAAPVATGVLTGLVVSRRNRAQDSDSELDVPSDYTTE